MDMNNSMLITVSNLFPRPDQPTRGLYNLYLFREMGKTVNICLVPEWRVWKWRAIRKWKAPVSPGSELSSCQDNSTTVYLPVFTLPFIGRSINWWFYCRAIRRWMAPDQTSDIRPQTSDRRQCGRGAPAFAKATADMPRRDSDKGSAYPSTVAARSAPPTFNLEPSGNGITSAFQSDVCGLMSDVFPPTYYVPWLYPDGVATARAIRGSGARLWLMALGTDTFHLKSAVRRRLIVEACGQAEGIVCVARALADRLAAAGVPGEKLHVVPNGVDTSLFRCRKKEGLLSCQVAELLGKRESPCCQVAELHGKKELLGCQVDELLSESVNDPSGLSSTTQQPNNSITAPKIILFVGNLVPVKGPDVMLRAVAALQKKLLGCQVAESLGKKELLSCQVAELVSEGANAPSGLSSTTQQPNNPTTASPPSTTQQLDNPKTVSPFTATQQPSNLTTILLLIGSGPMRRKLEGLARELGIAEKVHFLGRRPPEEVALWMNVADVLCLSSHSEGMPNVVLEARASGLPVVTTPAGAIPELPLEEDRFLVVKSCCPEDLAAGLREMLGRDLSVRQSDPAIPTWGQQAAKILELMERDIRPQTSDHRQRRRAEGASYS